jgi:patatin-like phospholipase/acyl hydrolase
MYTTPTLTTANTTTLFTTNTECFTPERLFPKEDGSTPPQPFRILSIDGGGIRGLAPALVLAALEQHLPEPLHTYFDLVAGTSTGGIIALALTKPEPKTAMELVKFYTGEASQRIFTHPSLLFQLIDTVFKLPELIKILLLLGLFLLIGICYQGFKLLVPLTGFITWLTTHQITNTIIPPTVYQNLVQGSLFALLLTSIVAVVYRAEACRAKHPEANAEAVFNTLYGANTQLGQALKPTLVTAYSMTERLATFFRSYKAEYAELTLATLARCTSAAPTFFTPKQVELYGTPKAFIDGGIVSNNPALYAYTELLSLVRKHRVDWKQNAKNRPLTPTELRNIAAMEVPIQLISLGTGSQNNKYTKTPQALRKWSPLQWVAPLIECFFDANDDLVHQQLLALLPEEQYFRFQFELPNNGSDLPEEIISGMAAMDNASPQNLQQLQRLIQGKLQNPSDCWHQQLQQLVMVLTT